MTAQMSGDASQEAREPEPAQGLRLRALHTGTDAAFPLSHDYFEIVYTPLIGPTAVLLARTMARHLASAGGPTTVCPVELALEVGIRARSTDPLGRRSHLVRTIDRLAHDHVVLRQGDRVLGVRLAIPPLAAPALRKVPEPVRRAHEQFLAARDVGSCRSDPPSP